MMRNLIPPAVIAANAEEIGKILSVVFEAAEKHRSLSERPVPADVAIPLSSLAAVVGWPDPEPPTSGLDALDDATVVYSVRTGLTRMTSILVRTSPVGRSQGAKMDGDE